MGLLSLAPAVAVACRGKSKWSRAVELDVRAPLDLCAEGIELAILDGIFETRMLAVRAIAPVALLGDHRLGNCERILGRAEPHDIGGARLGIGLAMGHAHAAAD